MAITKQPETIKTVIKNLFKFSFIILALAHGAYNALIPSFVINIFFVLLILVMIYKKYFERQPNYFFGILLIYIISHFEIINKYGGFTTIISFGIFIMMSSNKKKLNNQLSKDKFIDFLLTVFIIINIIGWLFRPQMSFEWVILGAIAFGGFIYMFNFSRKLIFHENYLITFYYIVSFLSIYESIVALNTYIGVFKTGYLIFLPAVSRFGSIFAEATFNHSEIFGEWSMMTAFILFPLIISKNIKINHKILVFGFIAAILNLFLSGSRSTISLTASGIFIIYFSSFIAKYKQYFLFGKSIKYSIIGIILIGAIWIPLNLGYALERFDKESKTAVGFNEEKLTLNSIITGEGTPREGAFRYFFTRYNEFSHEYWLFGYGFGTPEYNRNAWFGTNISDNRSDYHSLYLTLIVTYGYVGAALYLILYLYTIAKLFSSFRDVLKSKSLKLYFYPLFSFILIFIFLLLNEYKISLIRVSTYHMITWIWLGFAHAIINTIKLKKHESSLVSTISY